MQTDYLCVCTRQSPLRTNHVYIPTLFMGVLRHYTLVGSLYLQWCLFVVPVKVVPGLLVSKSPWCAFLLSLNLLLPPSPSSTPHPVRPKTQSHLSTQSTPIPMTPSKDRPPIFGSLGSPVNPRDLRSHRPS